MVDIIKGIIDIAIRFVNWLFHLQVEFIGTTKISLGVIVSSFLFLVISLYLILKALGFYDEE